MIFRLIRIASVLICMIVAASFLVFAADQAKGASAHQQEELNGKPVPGSSAQRSEAGAPKEAALHKALTEASNTLTSPFAGIVSSSSEWATRGVRLLLALLVYGFGLGYLARALRVRT